MNCWNCNTKIGHQVDHECMFWCDANCKQQHKNNERQKLLEGLERSQERMPGLNFLIASNLAQEAVEVSVGSDSKPKRKKRVEKGPRKCGRCGGTGHNVRTCRV